MHNYKNDFGKKNENEEIRNETTENPIKTEKPKTKLDSLSGAYRATCPVNLRVTPGMNGTICTVIPGEARVDATGESETVEGETWIKLRYKDYEGFSMLKYFSR